MFSCHHRKILNAFLLSVHARHNHAISLYKEDNYVPSPREQRGCFLLWCQAHSHWPTIIRLINLPSFIDHNKLNSAPFIYHILSFHFLLSSLHVCVWDTWERLKHITHQSNKVASQVSTIRWLGEYRTATVTLPAHSVQHTCNFQCLFDYLVGWAVE